MIWPFAPTFVHRPCFHGRNRVLVAMADAVVVVQAGLPSGALNSASYACKLRKPLWVVPISPWDEVSNGSLQLLDGGARPLTSAHLFLSSLGLEGSGNRPSSPGRVDVSVARLEGGPTLRLSGHEFKILAAVSTEPRHADAISTGAGMSPQATTAALLTLALENVVVEGPPGFFRRRERSQSLKIAGQFEREAADGQDARRRRVAREGQDDQEVPGVEVRGHRLQGARQGSPQEARDRHRERLQGDVRGHPRQGEGPRRAEEAPRRTSTKSCSRPTPTARARPSPGTSPRSSSRRRRRPSASSSTRSPRRASSTASATRASSTSTSTTRSGRAACSTASSATTCRPSSGASSRSGCRAGRVQSVALRLIVDREREIEAFVPEEYWNCGAALAPASRTGRRRSPFVGAPGRRVTARSSRSRTATKPPRSARDLEQRALRRRQGHQERAQAQRARAVHHEQAAAGRGQPPRLRRQAHDADRAGPLRGRRPRQGRGGPVGLITYMRTDSTRLSPDAVERGARVHRRRSTARSSSPRSRTSSSRRRTRRTRTRPSARRRSSCTPESVRKHLKDEQFKLYKLIWERFVACQMIAGRLRPDERRHRGQAADGARRRTACAPAAASSSSPAGSRPTARASPRRPRAARRRGATETRATREADGRGDAEGDGATVAAPRTPRRTLPELTEGAGAAPRDAARRASPSRSSRSRRRATPRPRSCASSKSAASAGRARTPRSSARCRRATTSRRSTAARFRPTTPRQVRGRRARRERARFHGPGLHVEDGGGARRGRGRQGGARRPAEALLQALPHAARRQQEGQALEPRARAHRREVRAATAA